MSPPSTIVLLVADSLRWDSVHTSAGSGLDYLGPRAVRFDQARSSGCWTLPATASLFTGLMPHQHGATSQTRGMHRHVPTLAERMQRLGYRAHMVTANVATTHIFGLDRGFCSVDRVWQQVPTEHRRLHQLLVLLGKPRLRRRVLSGDFVTGRMSEDLQAAKVWLQSTMEAAFTRARQRLEAAPSTPAFLFVNLMESHFPYHVDDTFRTCAGSLYDQLRELRSLYHLVNQTRLTRDEDPIAADMLALIRRRQRLAWERMAPAVDAFCQELRERYGATVVFCSDHGDAFGEQGCQYHFSNVTDAGNRVPVYWLHHDRDDARTVEVPVSTRHLFGSLLRAAGDDDPSLLSLVDEPERSIPVLQSYWYDNRGRTLDRFRYNQFAFVAGGRRYLHRRDRWLWAPISAATGPEPAFQLLDPGVVPLFEPVDSAERLRWLQNAFQEYATFSSDVLAA